MDSEWIKNLKVGDDVAYGGDRNGITRYQFSKVTKISPKRRIITLENGKQFESEGWERKTVTSTRCFRDTLTDVDTARKRLTEYEKKTQDFQRHYDLEKAAKAKIEDLSVEQLERLLKVLDTL